MAVAEAQHLRDTTELPYHFEVVALDDLFVDGDFQRALTDFWKKIFEKWDPAQLGVLNTNQRIVKDKPQKKLSVIDGQTRLKAAVRRAEESLATPMTEDGRPGLPCLVFEGMTKEEEARLFAKLQKNRRNMTSYDAFRARLAANDPIALAISQAAISNGFDLSTTLTPKTVKAVGALEYVYKRGRRLEKVTIDGEDMQIHDPHLLNQTLRIIHATWPDEPEGFMSGEIIRGLGILLNRNKKPPLDEERLIRRLGRETPMSLARRASMMREGAGGGANSPGYMADVMEAEYVRGR